MLSTGCGPGWIRTTIICPLLTKIRMWIQKKECLCSSINILLKLNEREETGGLFCIDLNIIGHCIAKTDSFQCKKWKNHCLWNYVNWSLVALFLIDLRVMFFYSILWGVELVNVMFSLDLIVCLGLFSSSQLLVVVFQFQKHEFLE